MFDILKALTTLRKYNQLTKDPDLGEVMKILINMAETIVLLESRIEAIEDKIA